MTTEEKRIVLVPSVPADMDLDVVFHSARGVGVRASAQDLLALESAGVPYVELYASGNEYAAAMENKSRDQAIAALESTQESRLAALTQDERDQFGVA